MATVSAVVAAEEPEPIVVPDPEEIAEAFESGFLDYEDYRALLEISTEGCLSREDSLFLLQFPDLLTGYTTSPEFNQDDRSSGPSPPKPTVSVARAHGVLFRHDQKLTSETESRQLGRIHAAQNGCRYYGEWQWDYDGVMHPGRRFVEYRFARAADTVAGLTVGSFNDRFGMGLIYGYHGQLFSKADVGDGMEGFLFPRYGGSNGLRLSVGPDKKALKFVYDIDRNEEYAKHFIGAAIPVSIRSQAITFSAAYGLLRSRENHASAEAAFISGAGEVRINKTAAKYELAAAVRDGTMTIASAGEGKIKKGGGAITIAAWRYGDGYPAWFTSGPSSRRSHASIVDEIGLSWSDRYGGETGGTVRVAQEMTDRASLHTTFGYAWRSQNDNRAEALLGVTGKIDDRYRVKLDCFWRADSLYSDEQGQRRIQMELVRQRGATRTRIVLGHRLDRQAGRDDFLLYAEQKMMGRYGAVTVTGKLDRFRPDDIRTQAVYVTVGHQAGISGRMGSVIKYSYRYRRGSSSGTYGQFRWDVIWAL